MPRKAKAIYKKTKDARVESQSKGHQKQPQMFSQSFKKRLDDYTQLVKEILTLKAKTGGSSLQQEVKQRRERISKRVEASSSLILSEELHILQIWMAEQQKRIEGQIKNIHIATEENKRVLESTGVFSEAEIQKQLKGVTERGSEKQSIHENYGKLLERSKVYSTNDS